jgi:3-oxoacyl-[acyl-carrier protein] reductase
VNLGLEGKAFIVGRASRGLGLAVASELVAEGAHVLLVARQIEPLDAAAHELGERASTCVADLGDPDDAARVAGVAAVLLGGLDGVFVNAGDPPSGNALDLTADEWLEAFDLILRAPLSLLRAAVPLLADEGGSILFLTSPARRPMQQLDSSNVLRPGIAALVRCLSHELAPSIRVNSVAPGHYGEPAEFARVAAFLLSPAASYMTGAAIHVDGGYGSTIP